MGVRREVERIAREFFELRYKTAALCARCLRSWREDWFAGDALDGAGASDDRVARAFETQFYCGPHLLVMPVLNRDGDVEGYLPEHDGGWYDLWSGMHVDGGEVVSPNYDPGTHPGLRQGRCRPANRPGRSIDTTAWRSDAGRRGRGVRSCGENGGYAICARGDAPQTRWPVLA